MAEQILMWDGHLWTVTRSEHAWTLTGQRRRGSMNAPTKIVRLVDAPTFDDIVPALNAVQSAQWARERAETLAGQRAEEAGYQQTKAIIGALDRGMPLEEIEAALEGRPHRPGRTVERCRRCGTSGYAGEYPFSTGYASGLCDDCGG